MVLRSRAVRTGLGLSSVSRPDVEAMHLLVRLCINIGLALSLAACDRPSIPATYPANDIPDAAAAAKGGSLKLLHVFANTPDGAYPSSGFSELNGTLYGVTDNGGEYGSGTVYSLTVTGNEKILHSCDPYVEGYAPSAAPIAYKGVLYGTVATGPNAYGTVYSLTPSGSFKILHKFTGPDGIDADSGLVEVGGLLYGVTIEGGAYNQGTMYAVDTSGGEHTVYNFGASTDDAIEPARTPTFWRNKLYGTTNGGGAYNKGTIYSVTIGGKETVVYSFGKGKSGVQPGATTLTPLGGALYGTTEIGGTHGAGTLFKLLPSGIVQTIYNFGDNDADGTSPESGPIVYKNALYGTTAGGGANDQGNIYRITPNGKETILAAFSKDEGYGSYEPIFLEGTNLYGTMYLGGADDFGTAYRFAL
jgi:uncharacterized repeat protein (TIGR03803 family)